MTNHLDTSTMNKRDLDNSPLEIFARTFSWGVFITAALALFTVGLGLFCKIIYSLWHYGFSTF
jgi:hypothetical protein